MTEAFGHDLRIGAIGQEQGGVGVAEVVQMDSRQPGAAIVPFEGAGPAVWVDGLPSSRVKTNPWSCQALPHGLLHLAPLQQCVDGGVVEVDLSTAAWRLGQ